jgi:inner membrane transporter RhtA
VLGIISVQTGSAVASTLFDELGVTGTALLRLTIAGVVLLAVLRPPVTSWSRHQWAAAMLLGLALAGMNVLFYHSLDLVPLGVAVTVEFTGPLLLALVQTRRLLDLAFAVLAGAGVALLGLRASAGEVAIAGLLLAFLAGLFWAGYIVASARVGRVLPGIDGLAVALICGAVIVAPFGTSEALAIAGEPQLLLGVFGVALLSSVIPYGLELHALRRIPTRVFGVLMSLEPAAAAISGWVILGQALGATEITALVMVSVASVGVTLSGRPGERPEEPVVGPIG